MGSPKTELITNELLTRRLHEAELTIQEFLRFHEEMAQEFDLQGASAQSRYICSRARRFVQQYRTLRLLKDEDIPPELIRPQPVALEPLIQEVIETFAPTLSRRQLGVDLKITPGIELAVRPDQFQALVHLLLENAIRFSRTGTLTVEVESEEDNLELTVCDQGAGIDRNLLRQLFEQVDSDEDQEDIPPSGIGLWLTKALVERLKASWEIHSDIDEGTQVKVRFGKGPHRSGIETTPMRSAESLNQESRPKILVVDDDRFTLNLVSLHLSQIFDPLLAQGGVEALETLRREAVDLVLLDLRMPDLDGIDVLSEIRELYSETELPVVFLTVESQAHALARLIELGGNDYLVKPVNAEELITKLRYHHNQATQFKLLRHDSAALDGAIAKIENRSAQIRRSLPIIAQLSLDVETPFMVFNRDLEVLFCSPPFMHCFEQSEAELVHSNLSDVIPLDWRSLYSLVQQMGPCLGLQLELSDSSQPAGAVFALECLLYPIHLGGAIQLPPGFKLPQWAHSRILTGRVFQFDSIPSTEQWPDFKSAPQPLELSFERGFSVKFLGQRSAKNTADDPGHLAVEVMQLCLHVWEEATGKTKFDLAEESGLWSASVDKKGTYRAKTLDRYLKLAKVPDKPRLATVEKTAQFVLSHCAHMAPRSCKQLSQALKRLQPHLN